MEQQIKEEQPKVKKKKSKDYKGIFQIVKKLQKIDSDKLNYALKILNLE